MSENIQELFLKDVVQEQDFLKLIGEEKIDKQLDLMKKVYAEQLESMVRLRFDIEIFTALMLLEPMNSVHSVDKSKATASLRTRRKVVQIIQQQIVLLIKQKDGKTN